MIILIQDKTDYIEVTLHVDRKQPRKANFCENTWNVLPFRFERHRWAWHTNEKKSLDDWLQMLTFLSRLKPPMHCETEGRRMHRRLAQILFFFQLRDHRFDQSVPLNSIHNIHSIPTNSCGCLASRKSRIARELAKKNEKRRNHFNLW